MRCAGVARLVEKQPALRGNVGIADAEADFGQEFFLRFAANVADEPFPAVFDLVGVGQIDVLDGLTQQLFAQQRGFRESLGFEVVAQLHACFAGFNPFEPNRCRVSVGVGDDLYTVAVMQLLTDRAVDAVDNGADGTVANIGVNGVGKVERARLARQAENFGFRGEYVNRIR